MRARISGMPGFPICSHCAWVLGLCGRMPRQSSPVGTTLGLEVTSSHRIGDRPRRHRRKSHSAPGSVTVRATPDAQLADPPRGPLQWTIERKLVHAADAR